MRARPLPLLGLLAFAVALLGGGAAARSASVVIGDGFDPAVLRVSVGTTVVWRNADDERHRVRSTAGPVAFDSGNLEPGGTFAFPFTVEGRYRYLDERHEGEDQEDDGGGREGPVGTIIVQAPDAPTTDAAPSGSVTPSVAPAVAPAIAQPASPSAAVPSPAPVASLAPFGQPSEPTTVAIVGRAFEPPSVIVAAGTTVEWTNRDGEGHTVSATDGSFDSGLMAGGMTFTMRFDRPGVYDYTCGIHPDMRGSVTVVAAAEPEVPVATPQSASPSAEAAAASSDQADVTIAQTAYGPASVDIAAGSTVSWTNEDPVIHTVTARDGSFNSGVLQPGADYRLVFETPGTYDYFCAVHPGQTGTIVVSDG